MTSHLKDGFYLGSHDIFSNSKKWVFFGDLGFSCDHFAKYNKPSFYSCTLRRRNTFANSSSGSVLPRYTRTGLFRIIENKCKAFNLEFRDNFFYTAFHSLEFQKMLDK